MPKLFCRGLVEFNGDLVRKCNFGFLVDGQPLFVKIILAVVILAGMLSMSYIFLKSFYKTLKYCNSRKIYTRKNVKLLFYTAFLFLFFFVPSILFVLSFF